MILIVLLILGAAAVTPRIMIMIKIRSMRESYPA